MFPALIAAAAQVGAAAMNQPPAAPGIAGPSGGTITPKIGNDFSGWTVATGGSRADGATISKENGLGGGAVGGMSPLLLIGGAIVGGVLLWRLSSKR